MLRFGLFAASPQRGPAAGIPGSPIPGDAPDESLVASVSEMLDTRTQYTVLSHGARLRLAADDRPPAMRAASLRR